MSEYLDMLKRKTDLTKKYSLDRGLIKPFNKDDRTLAISDYSKTYGIEQSAITPQQEKEAINRYLMNSKINSFLYDTDSIISEETERLFGPTKEKEKEKPNFFDNVLSFYKGAFEEIKELAPEEFLNIKKMKGDFESRLKDQIFAASSDGRSFGIVDVASVVSEPIIEYLSNAAPFGDKVDEAITSSIRSAIGDVPMMIGNGFKNFHENKLYTSNKIILEMENIDNFYEKYERYQYLSETRKKSNLQQYNVEFSEEEEKEYQDLVSELGEERQIDNYKSAVEFKNKKYYPLKVLGETLNLFGSTMKSKEVLNDEYTIAREAGLVDPNWKTGNFWTHEIPEALGQIGAIIGLTMLTPGVPDEYAVLGYAVNGLPVNIMFSASEAQSLREEAREMGYNEDEVNAMANKSFRQNIAVQGALGAAPGAVSKFATKFKGVQYMMNSSQLSRITTKITLAGIDASFEGLEEVLQDEIRNNQLKDDYKFFAEANMETFVAGFAGGLFGGANILVNEQSLNKTYKSILKDKDIGPTLQQMAQKYEEEGKMKLEARDLALADVMSALDGTAKGRELNDIEKDVMQRVLVTKVIKGTVDAKKREAERIAKGIEKMDIETQDSFINGTEFSYRNDESGKPNVRVVKGVEPSSAHMVEYGVNNMLMQKHYGDYNIEYDSKSNEYTSKENRAFTKLASKIKEEGPKLQKLQDMVTKLGPDVTKEDVIKYVRNNGLDMNFKEVNDLHRAGLISDSEYTNAIRELKLKPYNKEYGNNVKLGDKVNDSINNLDKLTEENYNAFKKQMIDKFGTFEKGMSTLEKIGAITPADSTKFKRQQAEFDKAKQEAAKKAEAEAKDKTKAELDTTKKTVEKQTEAAEKLKQENKKLKEENSKMKKSEKAALLPQDVVTLEELKEDTTKGKNQQEQKLDKIRVPDVKKPEIKDVVKEVEMNIQERLEREQALQYLRSQGLIPKETEVDVKKEVKKEVETEPTKAKVKRKTYVDKVFENEGFVVSEIGFTNNFVKTEGDFGNLLYVKKYTKTNLHKKTDPAKILFVSTEGKNLVVKDKVHYENVQKFLEISKQYSEIDSYDTIKSLLQDGSIKFDSLKDLYNEMVDKGVDLTSVDYSDNDIYDYSSNSEKTFKKLMKEYDLDLELDRFNFVDAKIKEIVESVDSIYNIGKDLGFKKTELNEFIRDDINPILDKYDAIDTTETLGIEANKQMYGLLYEAKEYSTISGKKLLEEKNKLKKQFEELSIKMKKDC